MNGPNELYKTYGQLTQTHCYECGKVGELQACSRCRRASFCSRACAAKAWSSSKPHKGFCKAWADMVAAGDGYAASDRAEAMDQCLSDLGLLMPALTGVYAHPALAKDLIYSEARCSSCCCTARGRASEGSRTSLQALRTCGDCGVARWCEACEGDGLRAHAADRDEDGRSQCEVLAEAAADQTISMIYHRDPHRPGPLLITQPEQCLSKPEPLPDNWTDYLSSWDCDAPPPFERTMTTLSLSFPLTVIAAIERFGLLERFDPPTSTPVRELEIHLIGAEVEVELVISGPTWEQLLHRLPTVKRLRLVLVGPSIKAGEQGTIHHDCCPTCTRAGRTRTVVLHQGPYHSVFGDDSTTRPTLAVAFNSGCHESPRSWQPTIDLLLARRIPSVFTSLQANEARDDARLIRSVAGDRLLWAEERNVYREEHAHVDPFSPHGVWRRNSHWLGFR